MQISLRRAKALIAKFRRQKILVVGDLMLDRYIYGAVRRLSPEAPVPIVLVHAEKNMPGGAANVARNVRALGARALICGTLGKDQNGRQLLRVMRQEGIDTKNVAALNNSKTTVKMRIIGERQQVVRVDWDGRLHPKDAAIEKLCRMAEAAIARCSGVILEDYSKGVIGQPLVSAILAAAQRHDVPVALDPKENRELMLAGISIIKPNRKEAFTLAGMPETEPARNPLQDSALLQAAQILLKKWNTKLLVITLGAQGMLVIPHAQKPFHVSTAAREVFDLSGAGDSIIATMLLALSAGASVRDAAELANCAAGVVVGKMGTATCSGQELLKFLSKKI